MAPETPDQIKAKVLQSLEGTRFAADSLEQLSGGVGNFLYRAHLSTPLEDGTAEVVIKHGENYIASSPDSELTLDRCKIEVECLKSLESFRISGEAESVKYTVRTPKLHQFDEDTNTQVIEYLPNSTNLKAYVLKNFASPTPASLRPQCHQLGKELAQWITGFHQGMEKDARDALQRGEKSKLYAHLEGCRKIQELKHMINYGWLLQRIDMFPDILAEARGSFEKLKATAEEELKGELMPIHGDFWTGNIVLPDVPIKEGVEIPLFVLDWELAQLGVRSLDLGQMLAEMYELWLYKKIDAGLWLVQGFAEGLGPQAEAFMFRVAAQLGCHLVSFGSVVPGWGTREQGMEVARAGRDLIVHSIQGNRQWFEEHELACLFALAK